LLFPAKLGHAIGHHGRDGTTFVDAGAIMEQPAAASNQLASRMKSSTPNGLRTSPRPGLAIWEMHSIEPTTHGNYVARLFWENSLATGGPALCRAAQRLLKKLDLSPKRPATAHVSQLRRDIGLWWARRT
jgi:hypothetical protein